MRDAAAIIEVLQRDLPDAVFEIAPAKDQPTIYVARDDLVGVCRALRDRSGPRFSFLADITAVDWLPREPRFEVVYHLACLGLPPTLLASTGAAGSGEPRRPPPLANGPSGELRRDLAEASAKAGSLEREGRTGTPERLRLKARVPDGDPHLPTVSTIWRAAGWLEREVWDLFGIVFDGHPDLRRLLMPDDWDGHPLRKDYPVQIDMPPRTHEPLQVTPEEFAHNIERARRH